MNEPRNHTIWAGRSNGEAYIRLDEAPESDGEDRWYLLKRKWGRWQLVYSDPYAHWGFICEVSEEQGQTPLREVVDPDIYRRAIGDIHTAPRNVAWLEAKLWAAENKEAS